MAVGSKIKLWSLLPKKAAMPGVEAIAAPIPNPTASMPSRVRARVRFIDHPFPDFAGEVIRSVVAVRRLGCLTTVDLLLSCG